MKYQIAYLSRSENSIRIARAIADILPEQERILMDLTADTAHCNADVCLLCFDLRNEACPFAVLDYIEELNSKTLLMIATSGLSTNEAYRERLENQIEPFLPEDCNYLGLCLCRGRLTEKEFEKIKQKSIEERPDVEISKLTEIYTESQSHPDMMDIRFVLRFVTEKLGYESQEEV